MFSYLIHVLYSFLQHEVLIDQTNKNLLHHLDLFECDPDDVFDDAKLPDGICDAILSKARMCSSKLATAWAVGGDPVRIEIHWK